MNGHASVAVRCAPAIAVAVAWPLCPQAQAQQPENRERASIVFGVFVTEPEISARLDSNTRNVGTDINFGDDLGLETSATIARLGGYYWFNRRNRIDASWFSVSLDGERRIDETIEFGDEVFAIDTLVETRADLDIVQASYTFAPVIRERSFLGVSAGLYVSKTEIGLEAPFSGRADSEDVAAPLPVIGLRGDWEFADQWTVRAAWQWFGIEVDDVEGHLTDTYVALDYGFGDKFAVGLAYNDTGLDIEETGTRRNTSLNWGYDGWMLYFKTDFGSHER